MSANDNTINPYDRVAERVIPLLATLEEEIDHARQERDFPRVGTLSSWRDTVKDVYDQLHATGEYARVVEWTPRYGYRTKEGKPLVSGR